MKFHTDTIKLLSVEDCSCLWQLRQLPDEPKLWQLQQDPEGMEHHRFETLAEWKKSGSLKHSQMCHLAQAGEGR